MFVFRSLHFLKNTFEPGFLLIRRLDEVISTKFETNDSFEVKRRLEVNANARLWLASEIVLATRSLTQSGPFVCVPRVSNLFRKKGFRSFGGLFVKKVLLEKKLLEYQVTKKKRETIFVWGKIVEEIVCLSQKPDAITFFLSLAKDPRQSSI